MDELEKFVFELDTAEHSSYDEIQQNDFSSTLDVGNEDNSNKDIDIDDSDNDEINLPLDVDEEVEGSPTADITAYDNEIQLNQYETRFVKSSHDHRIYRSYQIGYDPHSLLEFFGWIQLSVDCGDEIFAITGAPPWHVDETCCFIIDLESLNDRRDTFVDCWKWNIMKTYKTYGELGVHNDLWSKNFNEEKCMFVKRSWTCKDSRYLKKYVSAMYKPNSTLDKLNPLGNAERYAIIQYVFTNFSVVIPPTSDVRVYPSVKSMVRKNLDRGIRPKRAVHQVFIIIISLFIVQTAPNFTLA